MNDADFYRTEAQRCGDLADTAPSAVIARRWRELADKYVTLAEQIEARSSRRPPLVREKFQRQPVQQQQAKASKATPAGRIAK